LGGRLPPYLAQLAAPETDSGPSAGAAVASALNRQALDGVPPDDWQQILQGQLREQAARVLRLPAAALDVEQPLNNVGIDSLMAIELKNRIEADLAVTVPMVKFLEGPSVRDLSQYVADQLVTVLGRTAIVEPNSPSSALDARAASDLLERLDDLSNDQVDALLAGLTAEKGD
jgi:acyl carrier protein